ncbi:MAG: molybdopterin-guanine dinucleotide biosynthesis protein B [Candidatus Bipolaricaulota bacterium]|nr:MAG: molybdopterin-guanine dinucleotide biosynthesis protein B [Candidatus Bipolaricaulota bacterium]
MAEGIAGSEERRAPPPVVAIVGRSGAGKTKLLCELVRRLRVLGHEVHTVKHAPELREIDSTGSDSELHRRAGARRTLLVGAEDAALFWSHEGDEALVEAIPPITEGASIVLVEGGKRSPYPKIEVYRRDASWPEGPLAGEVDVLAVVTDDPVAVPDSVGVIRCADVDCVVELVEELIEERR